MALDSGLFHGVPDIGTLKSPGQYSPTDNSHPKPLQHHYPSCTTQASPPVMTDDQSVVLSGCRTPSSTPSPRRAEASVPVNTTQPSRSPILGPGSPQHGSAAVSQHTLMQEHQPHEQDHYSDDLQHRIKDMWPSRPSGSDNCDPEYGPSNKRLSETAAGPCSSRLTHASQDDNDYEKMGSHPRDWMGNSHNLFQQPFTWNNLPHATRSSLHPPLYYQNHLGLVHQGHSVHTSAPYEPSMGKLDHSFDDVHPNYLNVVPTTAGFQGYTASSGNDTITTLSPSTNLSFYHAPSAMRQDREDTIPFSEADIDSEYKDEAWWQDQLLDGSPSSSMDASGSKMDEPYAQLIYRAFLSRPNRSMTLQEIYQWFRDHTDKSKAEGKGWMNSIRHNLSMNGAFTKRNSKTPLSGNGDGSVSLDNSGIDGRKSTEWFLEPAFYAGVESTTRYRKGNSGSRSRGAGGHPGRSRLGSDSHGGAGGGFSHARVSAGRKGGTVAAQNRKRQQHARQMELARGHPRQLQHQGGFTGPIAMPYSAFEEGAYYPPYATPHLAPSPFPPGFGGLPTVIEEGQGPRQSEIVYNCFDSDDVGRDVHVKRSRTLGTDNDHPNENEPVTPPGSSLDPPQSAHFESKHREFLPDMTGSYNPLNSYQVGADLEQQQQQQQQQHQVYSSASVAGVYEPPAGGHQPQLFVDEDINLFHDDALLMNLDFGE